MSVMTVIRAFAAGMVLLVVAGCTSSSGAGGSVSETPDPTATSIVPGEPSDVAGPVAGIAAASEVPAHGDLPESAPSRLVVTGPGVAGVLELDTQTFDVRATTTPLEIGSDPGLAERFVSADLTQGGSLIVVVEMVDGTISARQIASSGELRAELAAAVVASHSQTDRVAMGDGSQVVVADLAGRVSGAEVSVPGRVDTLSWSPDGTSLAIGWTSSDGRGVSLGTVDGLEIVEVALYPTPLSGAWHHPTWLDDGVLAVVEQDLVPTANTFSGVASGSAPRLIVTDVQANRRLSSTLLPEAVTALDAAPDRRTLVMVTGSGALAWWSEGMYGHLDQGPWVSARW